MAGAKRVSRFGFAEEVAKTFGLDKSLIIPARMDEMGWVATRARGSSLDTSKACNIFKEKPYELGKALKVLGRWVF